jgi:hypothetical protein
VRRSSDILANTPLGTIARRLPQEAPPFGARQGHGKVAVLTEWRGWTVARRIHTEQAM